MNNDFHFGLEVEFVVFKKTTLNPALWVNNLSFTKIYGILTQIPFKDIADMTGIDPEEAHEEVSPFVVEGYHLKNEDGTPAKDMLVKGVEIRTPVCNSIQTCLSIYEKLLARLKEHLAKEGLYISAIGHHPTATKFEAERMGRRHDFWNWAKVAMRTYGPDINISYPKHIEEKIFKNLDRFHQRVNYYSPGMTALTLSGPFFDGHIEHRFGEPILSQRTLRRSPVAPAIEPHLNENGRMEFKFFEMAKTSEEYHAMFLLCLVLSLADENELPGLCDDHDRIYGLGEVSKKGLNAPHVFQTIGDLRAVSDQVLQRHGFEAEGLQLFWDRLDNGLLPGHDMIKDFSSHHSVLKILESRQPIISGNYV